MEAAGFIAAEAESCGLQPSRNDSCEPQQRVQAPTHHEIQTYGEEGGPATAGKISAVCEMGGAATAADSSITDPKDTGHSALMRERQASQCRADDGGIGSKAKTFGLESGSNRRDTEPSGANPPGSGRRETWGSRGSAHAHGATRHMG